MLVRLFTCLLLFLFSIIGVLGHGYLTHPKPRDDYHNATLMAKMMPTSGLRGNDFICRNFTAINPIPIKAGSVVEFVWDNPANHTGDCFLYASSDNGTYWYKISDLTAELNPPVDCRLVLSKNVTIPQWMPPGPTIFRWEMVALQRRTQLVIEYYANCFDAIIESNATTKVSQISPLTMVGYHLPVNVFAYRDVSTANKHDCETNLLTCSHNGTSFLVGPKVATVVVTTASDASTFSIFLISLFFFSQFILSF
eukprot:c12495_g1_i1.p1 GENE.c12495_g1_i1~~c12495_g1_i1.p1  ORF type:complete len:253 (+),score=79.34 c12495_g1_i1:36-794(+)